MPPCQVTGGFFYNLIIMKHIARGKKIKAATRVTRR
jgi:hypothetical protein